MEIEPHLALSYASGAGIDSVGAVGWAIAGGTSRIQYCAPTFATHGHVDFPMEFCLDAQHLFPVPGSNEIYRTENDSFAEVKAIGQGPVPSSWQVRPKDGRIRTYAAVHYDGTKTRFWVVESEMDRRGNAALYYHDHKEYWETCTNAQKMVPSAYPECEKAYTHFYFELDQIQYTAREGDAPRRKVVFKHGSPDPQAERTYVRVWDSSKQSFDSRDVSNPLVSIEMYGPTDAPWNGTPSLAWSYELTHTVSPDTGRPLQPSRVRFLGIDSVSSTAGLPG